MEPAPELATLVDRIVAKWHAGDPNAILDAISREPATLMIGFDAEEWWEGYETASALIRMQTQEQGGAFGLISLDSVGWKEGSVGWVSSRLHFALEGGSPTDVRLTVVLREEGAYWRIVQWHLSLGVSNEEVMGTTLTTNLDGLLVQAEGGSPPAGVAAVDGSVAIAFTDIEGSTVLLESLGEDRWMELRTWHDNIVTHQTAVFGGTVVKGQGDGFMLAFPAVGSAVGCAVAIQRTLKADWNGLEVPVRIGVHSGNAKVEGGDFFGRTVVVGARIAAAALGGEILVSEVVHEALGGAFDSSGSRSLSLRGLSGNHVVYSIDWA